MGGTWVWQCGEGAANAEEGWAALPNLGFLLFWSKVVYVLYWSMAVMAKIDTKVHIFIKLSGYM